MKDTVDIRPGREVEFRFHTWHGVKTIITLSSDGILAEARKLLADGSVCVEIARTAHGYSASTANMVRVKPDQTIAAELELPDGEVADIAISTNDLLSGMQTLLRSGHICARFSRDARGALTMSTWTNESSAPVVPLRAVP
jgi:hypothetical protein